MKFILLSFITAVLFCQCATTPIEDNEKIYWNNALTNCNIDYFLTYAINFPNSNRIDSCIHFLDSLVQIYPDKIIAGGYYHDSINNQVLIGFTDIDNFDYYLKRRNTFVLTITDSCIHHKGETITKTKYIDTLRFILNNHNLGDNYPQSKIIDSNHFGQTQVSKLITVIETNKSRIENNGEINWFLYFKTMQLIRESYYQIWNEKSNILWGKDFQDIGYAKQSDIIKTAVLVMELNFTKRKFYGD